MPQTLLITASTGLNIGSPAVLPQHHPSKCTVLGRLTNSSGGPEEFTVTFFLLLPLHWEGNVKVFQAYRKCRKIPNSVWMPTRWCHHSIFHFHILPSAVQHICFLTARACCGQDYRCKGLPFPQFFSCFTDIASIYNYLPAFLLQAVTSSQTTHILLQRHCTICCLLPNIWNMPLHEAFCDTDHLSLSPKNPVLGMWVCVSVSMMLGTW